MMNAFRGTVTLFILAVVGCGGSTSNRAEVSGTVTVNGEPVANGSISFIPAEGTAGPSAGTTIVDGKYRVARGNGPFVGRQRVAIRAMRKTGNQVESGFPDPPGTLIDEVVQFLPAKYNTASELVVDIERGANRHDFDLVVGRSESANE